MRAVVQRVTGAKVTVNDEVIGEIMKGIARVVSDLLDHDDRSLPSRVETRPSKPAKK